MLVALAVGASTAGVTTLLTTGSAASTADGGGRPGQVAYNQVNPTGVFGSGITGGTASASATAMTSPPPSSTPSVAPSAATTAITASSQPTTTTTAAPPGAPVTGGPTTTQPGNQPPPRTTTTQPPVGGGGGTSASQVLSLTNAERARAGCPPLRLDSRLNSAAQSHSNDMSARHYFSHTTPEGLTFADRARAAGYDAPAAENIAAGYTSASAVMAGWMSSSGHRANILNCAYLTMGSGYAADGNYWTQLFGW
ncbi:uncharacterized protein YkwD [Actinokineospora auranticolor]|uniref:Uncharacterized protein YkwD n=1 Tax=Actinokineospora auranticolor TaxID=155976 RepID=A0A2S6GGN4_9PSEU|nr:uncharacterized protein YkwD [Actinokineospora auranticolor]